MACVAFGGLLPPRPKAAAVAGGVQSPEVILGEAKYGLSFPIYLPVPLSLFAL